MDTIMTVTILLSVALFGFGLFFDMMEGRFKKVGNVMTILSIYIFGQTDNLMVIKKIRTLQEMVE